MQSFKHPLPKLVESSHISGNVKFPSLHLVLQIEGNPVHSNPISI